MNLSRANLAGACLAGATLRGCKLCEASLQGADLTGADLSGADLSGADLTSAKVGGAHLNDATLVDATLTHVAGLIPDQLGRSDLRRVRGLTPDFPRLALVNETVGAAQAVLISLLLACTYSCLTVAATTDVALLTDSSMSSLPLLGVSIPIRNFYLAGPLIVLSVFVYFNVYLTRLWYEIGHLPAIFPDGRTIEELAKPWLPLGLVQSHMRVLRARREPLSFLQRGLTNLLVWWISPLTLLFFWLRYLPRQDLLGSCVHTTLCAAAWIAAATFRSFGLGALSGVPVPAFARGVDALRGWRTYLRGTRSAAGLVAVLVALTLSVLRADSVDAGRSSAVSLAAKWLQVPDAQPRTTSLGARFLRWVGFNPFPDLRGDTILPPSGRPNDPSGSGYRASLAGRSLRLANTGGARLAGLDLHEADARGALFDGADLSRCNLRQTHLENVELRGANLRGADLRFARLRNASLRGADLRGADLTGADVHGAVFDHADLRGARLRALRNGRAIRSVSFANVHGVLDAPQGLVTWARHRDAVEIEDDGLWAAERLRTAGDLAEAQHAYEALRGRSDWVKVDVMALYGYGSVLRQRGDVEQALQVQREALTLAGTRAAGIRDGRSSLASTVARQALLRVQGLILDAMADIYGLQRQPVLEIETRAQAASALRECSQLSKRDLRCQADLLRVLERSARAMKNAASSRDHSGAAVVATVLTEAESLTTELLHAEPDNPRWLLARARVTATRGEAAVADGRVLEGLRLLRQARSSFRELAKNEEHPAASIQLGRMGRQLGETAAKVGHVNEAVEEFASALEVTAALIEEEPENAELRVEHSALQLALGRVRLRQGEHRGAESALGSAADTMLLLIERDPLNGEARAFLLSALLLRADLECARGTPEGAKQWLDEADSALGAGGATHWPEAVASLALAKARRLLAQGFLADATVRLAEGRVAISRLAGSSPHRDRLWREELLLRVALLRRHARPLTAWRSVQGALGEGERDGGTDLSDETGHSARLAIAELGVEAGDDEAGYGTIRETIQADRERLVSDPRNEVLRLLLARAQNTLAGLFYRRHQFQAALEHYNDALHTLASPGTADLPWNTALHLETTVSKLGRAQALGRLAEETAVLMDYNRAYAAFRDATDSFARVAQLDPGNLLIEARRAQANLAFADFLRTAGDADAAARQQEEVERTVAERAASRPLDLGWQSLKLEYQQARARSLEGQQRYDEAVRWYGQAFRTGSEQLAHARFLQSPHWRLQLAEMCWRYASLATARPGYDSPESIVTVGRRAVAGLQVEHAYERRVLSLSQALDDLARRLETRH